MKYEISVSDGNTYLYVNVKEAVTVELLEDFICETGKKANECGINNFLFDLRQAHNQTGLFYHYEMVYKLSKQFGFKSQSKHALLVSQPDKTDYAFVETILINAGYQSKIFTDELAAIGWLEK